MLLAISDASVLVDMADTGLLVPLIKLPYELLVPDFVVSEITRDEQRTVVESLLHEKKLSVLTASAEDLRHMEVLLQQQSALSFADCSVVILADRLGALVLSNDSRIRKAAEGRKLTCHGTLWIIRQLTEQGGITVRLARTALLRLIEVNPRLPKSESIRLLHELGEDQS